MALGPITSNTNTSSPDYKFEIFEGLFTRIDLALNDIINAQLTQFISSVTAYIPSVLGLWVIFKAWETYKGRGNLDTVFYDIMVAIIIVTVATNIAIYNELIRDNIMILGDWITQIVADNSDGENIDSIGKLLDANATSFFESLNRSWQNLGVLDIIGKAMSILFLFLTFCYLTVIIVYTVGIAKMGTAILLVLGPIFISSLLFRSTKQFFTQWLNFIINFQLTIGLTSIIMVFFIEIGTFSSLNFDGNFSLSNLLLPFVMIGISIALMKQVPQLATALAGGISLSVDNLVNNTVGAAKKTVGAAKKTAGAALSLADNATGNKVSQALPNLSNKVQNNLPQRLTPRFYSERKEAFKLQRQGERQKRVEQHGQKLNGYNASDKPKNSTDEKKTQANSNKSGVGSSSVNNRTNAQNQSVNNTSSANAKPADNSSNSNKTGVGSSSVNNRTNAQNQSVNNTSSANTKSNNNSSDSNKTGVGSNSVNNRTNAQTSSKEVIHTNKNKTDSEANKKAKENFNNIRKNNKPTIEKRLNDSSETISRSNEPSSTLNNKPSALDKRKENFKNMRIKARNKLKE